MKTEPNDPIEYIPFPEEGENLGLTKREYFAAQALSGLIAAGFFNEAAIRAVKAADLLIEALNHE